MQRVIELTFADEDISVVAFSDGDHAIASLSRTPPDIVLADIGMPGRSGYDVARYIKQTPELSHIPVLLLTGAFEPVDHARVREAGCDGVLTKPLEPQLVLSRVKELLTRSDPASAEAIARASRRFDKASEIENYFEQLDQAFATLASTTPSAAAADPLPMEPVAHPTSEAAGNGSGLADAFVALLTAEQSGASSGVTRADLLPQPSPEPSISLDEIVEQVTSRVMAKLAGGMVRDAAAGILAPTAERLVTTAIAEVVMPIAEHVVRSAIADIVSTTAERLIREEIERIKSNIK